MKNRTKLCMECVKVTWNRNRINHLKMQSKLNITKPYLSHKAGVRWLIENDEAPIFIQILALFKLVQGCTSINSQRKNPAKPDDAATLMLQGKMFHSSYNGLESILYKCFSYT